MKGHARISGVSGLAFAALLVVSMLLLHRTPGLNAAESTYAAFYRNGNGGDIVTVGLYLVPFAGIAFLWHMAAIRTFVLRLPGTESGVRRVIQLASGVLFVGTLYGGAAAVGAVALLTRFSDNAAPDADIARALTSAGYGMVFVYGVRMAGMYMLVTTLLAHKGDLLARHWTILSYVAGAFLLISTTFHPVILLVFPGWIVLISVLALVHADRLEEVAGVGTADDRTT